MRLELRDMADMDKESMDKNLSIGVMLLCIIFAAIFFGILTVQVRRCCNIIVFVDCQQVQLTKGFRSLCISVSTRKILGAFRRWQVVQQTHLSLRSDHVFGVGLGTVVR